jgi:hypothetical protein
MFCLHLLIFVLFLHRLFVILQYVRHVLLLHEGNLTLGLTEVPIAHLILFKK